MKLTTFVLLALSTLAGSPVRAQTGVLDQDSPVAGAAIGLTPSVIVWQQQLTLGAPGYVEGVRLHLDGSAGAQVDVRLRSGGGWSTSPIAYQTRVTKLANGIEASFVPMAGAVRGPAGTIAVIELANASGTISAWRSYVEPPGAPLYSQPLFVNGGPGCYADCGWRIGFQTFLVGSSQVSTYCTSGVTTNGCAPTIAGIGPPSHAGIGSFVIQGSNIEGQKLGPVFFGSAGPQHVPFGAGSSSYSCVRSPVQRTNAQNSGGTAGQCNGSIGVNWNAWVQTHPTFPFPFPGQAYWAQVWFRDPGAVGTTSLTNGLFFVL